VREALGYGAPHFPLADHYAREGEEWMYGRGSHERLTDSGDWREHIVLTQHRYMLEDTRIGLSLLISVGELAGVPTPLARAFLSIGSGICGEDFMRSGRTLASLGLGQMDRAGLQELLREGFV
jgi:opine dehydrogenase